MYPAVVIAAVEPGNGFQPFRFQQKGRELLGSHLEKPQAGLISLNGSSVGFYDWKERAEVEMHLPDDGL